jgi:hypothetical protein
MAHLPGVPVLDLGGATLLPGLIDAHVPDGRCLPTPGRREVIQRRRATRFPVSESGSTCGPAVYRYPPRIYQTERRPPGARVFRLRITDGVLQIDGRACIPCRTTEFGSARFAPGHLETVVSLLERFDEAAVAFSLVRHVGSRSGVWSPKHFIPAEVPIDAFWQCLSNNIVPHMSAVVRRSAVLDVGGYDVSMRTSQDFDLWLRMSLVHKFVRSSKVTANYRWHEAQTGGPTECRPAATRNPFVPRGPAFGPDHE